MARQDITRTRLTEINRELSAYEAELAENESFFRGLTDVSQEERDLLTECRDLIQQARSAFNSHYPPQDELALENSGNDKAPGEAGDTSPDEGESDAIGSLSRVISDARRRPLNFAWLLSETGLVLRTDRRKPVDALVKAAKAEGGKARGAWGRFQAQGRKIVLDCDNAPPAKTMIARAKRVLKSEGLVMRVEFVSATERSVAEMTEAEIDGQEPVDNTPAASDEVETLMFEVTRKDDPDRQVSS